MKKNNLKQNHSGYKDDYDSIHGKGIASKNKSLKKRLSIYEDFEEEEEDFEAYEKFKKRHK